MHDAGDAVGRKKSKLNSKARAGATDTLDSMVPGQDNPVASGRPAAEIGREFEASHGWRFEVLLARPGSADPSRHEMTLSWVDYEFWCHGQSSPSRVAQAVVDSLLGAKPELTLPPKFDASTCRRWVRDLDERVAEGF
jgi:hypothetical protein